MTRVFVARVLLGMLLWTCACRRKHEGPSYASDTPAATPSAASTPAPSDNVEPTGASANPLNEPVLIRGNDGARMPDGGTMNGDPRGPRAAEWRAIVDGAMPRLQACFDRTSLPPGAIPVTMHYTIELPGYTGAVTAKGSAPKAVLDCCVTVVEELKFPQYRGSKLERDLTFTWTRRAASPASPDGGAPAAGK